MKRLIAAVALSLYACGGGGGGGGSSAPPPTPPAARTTPLRYGYFGVDGDQLQESAPHVSFVFAMDWSEPFWPDREAIAGRIIAQLQEAHARGIKEAWVAVGFLVFTAQRGGCPLDRYTPRADAAAQLAWFMQRLDALGLREMVHVLYPVDEPELHCLTDATLTPVLQTIKAAWPDPYLGVIYGDTQTYPGLASYQLVGKDKYGDGANALNEQPPIVPGQLRILPPGGASPWRNEVQPFLDYAMSHAEVYALVPFAWFDRPPGPDSGPGIRSNGMADEYRAAGLAALGTWPRV